jgi:hypothetical protein
MAAAALLPAIGSGTSTLVASATLGHLNAAENSETD